MLRLEAIAPAHRCFRAYEIASGRDLFGAWLVEMRFGRIGTAGRTRARSFGSLDQAAAQVRVCLRRRATAPRRIGAAYQLCHAACDPEWQVNGLEGDARRFAVAADAPPADG